ncbi:MAG: Uma2 family endonuclease [bacterium]
MEVELLTPTAPSRAPSVKRITFDEYLDLLTEESKGDLIDGVLYMQTPPSDDHEQIFGFLFDILRNYVIHKKLGVVRGSRTTLKFSEENGVQPDIVFISNVRRYLIHPYYVDGAPDVAIEILSPSTRKLDRGKKMALYAAHGVLELWQVDPEGETAEFFRNDSGVWTPMPVNEDGIFHSEAIPGFWLKVQWLFDEESLNMNSLDIIPLILARNN